MKKTRLYTCALTFLVLLLSFNLVYAQDETNPLIILDDDSSIDWYNSYSWGLSEETTYKKVGDNSFKIVIPASSQYENIYLDFQANLTNYDYLAFWFKGNASGNTLRFDLTTTMGAHAYYHFEGDDRLGWEFFELEINDLSVLGSPDIADINFFAISLSSDNGVNPVTLYIDWVICSIGEPPEAPEETPTRTEYLFDFETLFIGEWAFIGVIFWIILGFVVIKLNKYGALFVFILSVLYEVVLYDNLNKFGNNVYYIIILLVYAFFCTFYVWKKK